MRWFLRAHLTQTNLWFNEPVNRVHLCFVRCCKRPFPYSGIRTKEGKSISREHNGWVPENVSWKGSLHIPNPKSCFKQNFHFCNFWVTNFTSALNSEASIGTTQTATCGHCPSFLHLPLLRKAWVFHSCSSSSSNCRLWIDWQLSSKNKYEIFVNPSLE